MYECNCPPLVEVLACAVFPWPLHGRNFSCPVRRPPLQVDVMTVTQIVGYCLTAFGIGYGIGHAILLARRAIESLD